MYQNYERIMILNNSDFVLRSHIKNNYITLINAPDGNRTISVKPHFSEAFYLNRKGKTPEISKEKRTRISTLLQILLKIN